MDQPFRVDQIDHVEFCVPDRRAAAEWYCDVLGFQIVPEFAHWADDPRGPLMIATPQGGTKLALFDGRPEGSRSNVGFHLVAFRVNSAAFLRFVDSLNKLGLIDDSGRAVTRDLVSDHGQAFSIYFCDPYGNQLELTTYDYAEVAQSLGGDRDR